MLNDVDAAEEWLDSWVASVDSRAGRGRKLSTLVDELTAILEG